MKEALSDKGINAADLSRLSKINQSSLSQYLNGTNKPNSLRAMAIASILEVNPVWLMGFDVPKYVVDEKSQHDNYYINPETAKVAQAIFDDSDLHALFDAAQNSKPEDLKMAADLLRRLKSTNSDG
jgi:transcriptional regulator with XRE-family HTH domain